MLVAGLWAAVPVRRPATSVVIDFGYTKDPPGLRRTGLGECETADYEM
jgi:hypothetical protein